MAPLRPVEGPPSSSTSHLTGHNGQPRNHFGAESMRQAEGDDVRDAETTAGLHGQEVHLCLVLVHSHLIRFLVADPPSYSLAGEQWHC